MAKVEKENKLDVKYHSVIEEMRRYVRHNKKINVYYNDKNKLFDDLITVLRKTYGVPNKDFSLINTTFMVNKTSFTINEFEKPEKFVISTSTKNGYKFTTSYLIKKTILKNKYYVRYCEVAKAPVTVWGMKASIAKWWYKKEIKKNVKLLKKKLKELNNTQNN